MAVLQQSNWNDGRIPTGSRMVDFFRQSAPGTWDIKIGRFVLEALTPVRSAKVTKFYDEASFPLCAFGVSDYTEATCVVQLPAMPAIPIRNEDAFTVLLDASAPALPGSVANYESFVVTKAGISETALGYNKQSLNLLKMSSAAPALPTFVPPVSPPTPPSGPDWSSAATVDASWLISEGDLSGGAFYTLSNTIGAPNGLNGVANITLHTTNGFNEAISRSQWHILYTGPAAHVQVTVVAAIGNSGSGNTLDVRQDGVQLFVVSAPMATGTTVGTFNLLAGVNSVIALAITADAHAGANNPAVYNFDVSFVNIA